MQQPKANFAHLANTATPDSRDFLATEVLDAFERSESAHTELENELFSSLTARLLVEVSDHICSRIVERINKSENISCSVARNLSYSDNERVFAPILSESTKLNDQELVDVVHAKGSSHALVIAQRQTISTTVTDALIATHDATVISTTVKNKGASFSNDGLNALVSLVEKNPLIRESVDYRTQIDKKFLKKLRNIITSRLKGIDSNFSSYSQNEKDSLQEYINKISQARFDDLQQNIYIKKRARDVLDGLTSSEKACSDVLDEYSSVGVVFLMSNINEIPYNVLRKMYFDTSKPTFEFVLLYSGISLALYSRIIHDQAGKVGLSSSQCEKLEIKYASLCRKDAKRAVRLMKIAAKSYAIN